jgi:hypothetical protein
MAGLLILTKKYLTARSTLQRKLVELGEQVKMIKAAKQKKRARKR